MPLPPEVQDPLHCHVTVASRPETIRVIVEDRLKDGTQDHPEHLLSDTVPDSGDAERPSPSVPLGDQDATQGQRPKDPSLELPHQGQQVRCEIVLVQTNADLVDPRRTAIPLDVAKGVVHQGLGDPSRQRVRFDLGHTPILSCYTPRDDRRQARGGVTLRMFLSCAS